MANVRCKVPLLHVALLFGVSVPLPAIVPPFQINGPLVTKLPMPEMLPLLKKVTPEEKLKLMGRLKVPLLLNVPVPVMLLMLVGVKVLPVLLSKVPPLILMFPSLLNAVYWTYAVYAFNLLMVPVFVKLPYAVE